VVIDVLPLLPTEVPVAVPDVLPANEPLLSAVVVADPPLDPPICPAVQPTANRPHSAADFAMFLENCMCTMVERLRI
jgi:hypothetical protein